MTVVATPENVLRKLIDGVTERRWSELPALYAEDTVVEHPFAIPEPTRLIGREALRAHFAAAGELPIRMRAEHLVIHHTHDPEVVIGEFDYVGEVTTTGRPFRIGNIFVLRVRDGLIVESRDYANHLAFARALDRLTPLFEHLQGGRERGVGLAAG